MPRSFPVPVYTTTAVAGGANQRTLSTTSPGTTDSTATTLGTSALAAFANYLVPETGTSGAGTNATGWAFNPVGPLVPTSSDAFTLDAGTFTFPFHYSRPGGLLTGNVTATVLVELYRANAGLSSFTLLGSTTSASITVTTTEQSINISVSIPQSAFAAGEKPWVAIKLSGTAGLTTDTIRVHTNSTTALRITAAPTYQIQYARAISDSCPCGDGLGRQIGYGRALSDSCPASDGLSRRVDRFRALTEDAPCSDSLVRRVDRFRSMNDSAPCSDAMTRRVDRYRAMNDDSPCSDSLNRRVDRFRSLSDSCPASDGLSRRVSSFRALSDNAPCFDTFARAVAMSRALNDSAAANEMLNRQVGYSRLMQENLSAGGGTTILIRRTTLINDD